MLQSISWSQFLITLFVLAMGYYLVVCILLYAGEITSFLKGKPRQSSSEDVFNSARTKDDHSLMGETRSSNILSVAREENVPSEELIFSELKESEETIADAQVDRESLLVGTVADLLEEIKSQAETIRGWKKDEVVALLRELLAKYPQLIGTQYQDAINLFIMNTGLEHVEWEFRPEELSELWSLPNQ